MNKLLILTMFVVLTPAATNFIMDRSHSIKTEILCSMVGLSCPQDTQCCSKSNGDLDCCPETQTLKSTTCPGGKSQCPDGQTCCLSSTGVYGCCPFPNAVCCSDGQHCCPSGRTCDVAHRTCKLANTDFLGFIGYRFKTKSYVYV